jgi:DNA-directed RNA polymerase specialized sigma subunit
VYAAGQELQDSLGREPSDAEIADKTGISVKRLVALRTYRRPVAEGRANWENPEGEVFGPAVVNETPQSILEDFIYHDLNPKDQLILDYSLGRNGRPQLNGRDIALRVGLTPGAVSQRLAGIQQRFNTLRDMQLFGGD